jgi:hypothetical protein
VEDMDLHGTLIVSRICEQFSIFFGFMEDGENLNEPSRGLLTVVARQLTSSRLWTRSYNIGPQITSSLLVLVVLPDNISIIDFLLVFKRVSVTHY